MRLWCALGHGLDLDPGELLVGLERAVAHLEHELEGELGVAEREHDLVDVDVRVAELPSTAEVISQLMARLKVLSQLFWLVLLEL